MALAHQLWFPWIGPGTDTSFHKTKHFFSFYWHCCWSAFSCFEQCLKTRKKADAILDVRFPVETKYYLLLGYINNAFKPLGGYIDKEHILD